ERLQAIHGGVRIGEGLRRGGLGRLDSQLGHGPPETRAFAGRSPWTSAVDPGRRLGQACAMDSEAFSGAKIALVCGGRLVTYQRDAKPSIPWPGLWDLPGGGREGVET